MNSRRKRTSTLNSEDMPKYAIFQNYEDTDDLHFDEDNRRKLEEELYYIYQNAQMEGFDEDYNYIFRDPYQYGGAYQTQSSLVAKPRTSFRKSATKRSIGPVIPSVPSVLSVLSVPAVNNTLNSYNPSKIAKRSTNLDKSRPSSNPHSLGKELSPVSMVDRRINVVSKRDEPKKNNKNTLNKAVETPLPAARPAIQRHAAALTPNQELGEQPLGFLTLDKFLSYFPPIKISKPEFVKRFTVSYRTPVSLAEIYSITPGSQRNGEKTIIKSTDDVRWRKRQEVIDYFYDVVVQNRQKYLTHFYHSFFDFKDPMTIPWASGPEIGAVSTGSTKKNALNLSEEEEIKGISMQKNDASRRLIRNLFYKDILDYTRITNSVKSKVSFWQTFDNLYNKLILEDRLFAPSSIDLFLKDKRGNERVSPRKPGATSLEIPEVLGGPKQGFKKGSKKSIDFDKEDFEDFEETQPRSNKVNLDETNYVTMYYLIQNYQPKASILNPYTIYYILDRLLPGTKNLFTPVLSWGSYLMAFMHLPYTETYVGVDVIPRVCAKVEYLADWYKKNYSETRNKEVDIYCQPSESLLNDKLFLRKYTNFFDSVLLCPPYFDMEVYQGGSQSIEVYPKYEDWLKGYWEGTVKLSHITLKKGRYFAYIINDYYDLDKNFYPLIEDLARISSKYFKLVDIYTLYNRTSPLRANHKDRSEKLYIFKKV